MTGPRAVEIVESRATAYHQAARQHERAGRASLARQFDDMGVACTVAQRDLEKAMQEELEVLRGNVTRAPLEVAEVAARRIGELVGPHVPPGWCFALVLASIGPDGFMTYLSNAERAGVIALFRETADKIEKGAQGA